jgi:hypothetical protein
MGKVTPPRIERPKNILINFSKKLEYLSPMDDMKYVMDWLTVENTIEDANSKEKVEKLYTQPKNLFEAVDFTNLGVIDESEKFSPKFIEGENYSLKGVSCDGFEMEEKVYKLVKVVDDFYGTSINSVIVKQISGEQGIVFTLSKNDCDYHGIEYEKGLQLFPKNLPWTRVKEKIPFDKNNLSTTPVSDIDNTIRFILLRLDGFKDYLDGYVLTPSGHLITEKHFIDTIRVTSKEPIVFGNGFVINDNTNLDIELVYPKNLLFNHANFISSEDTIFVMIRLKMEYGNAQHGYYDSIDRCFGVEPKYLEGINPTEFFEISWDELGAYTVEEYEALKAEKARKKAEKARKIEEERKRKIAEEEKRIKEQRRRAEAAVDRMRGYHMKLPSFPPIPNLNFNGSVGSIDMIVNTLDTYFDSLDKSLTIISEDLSTMSKLSGLGDIRRIVSNKAYRKSVDENFKKLLNNL